MDLYAQYDSFERWREIWGWFVLVGVFLEVFETIAELKRTPDMVDFGPTYTDESIYGRLKEGHKPTSQKWLVFIGWLVLFCALFGENLCANRSREIEVQIRSSSGDQIELLKTELRELRSRVK